MSIGNFITSVAALCAFGYFASSIIPEGNMKGVGEKAVALAVTVVTLSVFMGFFSGGGFNVETSGEVSVECEGELLEGLNGIRDEYLKSKAEEILRDYCLTVEGFEVMREEGEIKKITVYFSQSVIDGENGHINIIEVKEVLAEELFIDKGRVELYGEREEKTRRYI